MDEPSDSGIELPVDTPIWSRFFTVAPLVLVGTREPDGGHDLAPKQSKTIDYYPHGHLSVVPVDKLTVEIEPTIGEEETRLFRELAL